MEAPESLGAYMQGKLSLKDFEWPQSQRPSSFLSTTLSCTDAHLIPQIDMQALVAQLRKPNAQGHIPVAQTKQQSESQSELKLLRDAVSSCGFFQVRNHGIPLSALRALLSFVEKFFAMDIRQKLHVGNKLGNLNAESFRSGYMCGSPLHCPIKWWCESVIVASSGSSSILTIAECLHLDEVDQRAFREALETCEIGLAKLAREISTILLQELEVDFEEVLKENIEPEEGTSGVKISHYPACPQPEKTLGLPAHTDICLLTVLWQDEVGGLQVLRDGHWITVEPCHDTLVVNIGDIFQAWSNDRFKSGSHRVLLNSAKSRYSIGYFHNPSSKSLVGPLPQLLKLTNESPKFRSMVDQEYRNWGFKEVYEDRWQGIECLRCFMDAP